MNFDPEASRISWDIDFSSADDVAPPVPPQSETFADRFRIEGLLGEGGMGSVFLAEELSLGRKVAIKLLSGEVKGRQRERFVAEGRITAKLRHPGIVRVFGAGRAGDRDFLIYELIEGGRPLGEVFDEVSLEERLGLLLQLCDALGAAHALGVVHRDLKGDNVLVDLAGHVRVLDFGIAHMAEIDRVTLSGEFVGTPLYMAPERFGTKAEVTPALDVWSIGVMLHLALTSEYPFEGTTLLQLVHAVRNPVRDLSSTSLVSPALMAVCLRCLRLEPAERYPDAGSIGEALRLALSGDLPTRSARSRVWKPALLLTSALIAVGGLGVFSRSRPLTSAAVERLVHESKAQSWPETWRSGRFATPESREALAVAILGSTLPLEERIKFGVLAAEDQGATYRLRLTLSRLYAEQGEPALALGSILTSRTLGAPSASLIDSLTELSRRDPNLSFMDQLLGETSWPVRDWGPRLVLQVTESNPDQGATILRRLEPRLRRDRQITLRAHVTAALGGDPRPELEVALAAKPTETAALELALAHLEAADRSSAVEVLRGRDSSAPKSLAKFLEEPNRQAPTRWRKALATTIGSEIRLELALARRGGALPLTKRRARVLVRAESLAAIGADPRQILLAKAWAREGSPDQPCFADLPEWAMTLQAESFLLAGRSSELEARHLRPPIAGRVLLAQGEAEGAYQLLLPLTLRHKLPNLEVVTACLNAAHVARPNRASGLEKLAASLRGELSAKAEPALRQLREARAQGWKSFEDAVSAMERVFALDPANREVLFLYARALYARGDEAGEELFFKLGNEVPILMTKCQHMLLDPERRLPRVLGPTPKLFLRLRALELDLDPQLDPAGLISDLDKVLDSEPASQWARTLRAFAAIRARRFARAEEDLRTVLEEEPRCGQAHFYLALLAGARRQSEKIMPHFLKATRHGYFRSSDWSAKRYPELARYSDRPWFEQMSRR